MIPRRELVFLDIYEAKLRKDLDFRKEMIYIDDEIDKVKDNCEYEIIVERLSEDAERTLKGLGYKVSNGCVRHTKHKIQLF